MKRFPQKKLEELLDILQKHGPALKALKGVHYVDIGYKFVGGEQKDELAICVHVHKKIKPESAVEPSQRINPDKVEGALTDIIEIETNPETPSDKALVASWENVKERSQHFIKLVGGISIWNAQYDDKDESERLPGARRIPGTLGAIVYDTTNGDRMGLSNWHVLVDKYAKEEDPIKQGDINEYPRKQDNVIGSLYKWDKNLDCAVFKLNDNGRREISSEIYGYPIPGSLYKEPTGVKEAVPGMRVVKSGVATGITFGKVKSVNGKEFTIIPDPKSPRPNGEISNGWDSGSVWLEVESFNAVGLHCRGEDNKRNPDPKDEKAVAKQMVEVVKALNITFIKPEGAPAGIV